MNFFHRSNLALAIFDIVDLQGNRAAQVWAFEHPDMITIAMEDRAPPTFAMNHRPLPWGSLQMEGYDPKGIHVVDADDLADAVRNHWGRFTERTAIGVERGIERG